MGACYDVRLKVQFSASDAKEKVVATMQEYIKKETSVDFSLDKYGRAAWDFFLMSRMRMSQSC